MQYHPLYSTCITIYDHTSLYITTLMLYHNHKLTVSSAPGLTQATPNEYSLIVLACVLCYSGTSCVLYEHLGTNHKCPDYQGVLIINVS